MHWMRRAVWFIGIAAAIALGRLGLVMLSRHDEDSKMERAREASRRRAYGQTGADDGTVKITQFYATSGEIIDGRQGIVCYGVQNAKFVRIEPPVENLTPVFSRCFWVEPKEDTTYTLFAVGADGRQVTESFSVKVKPAPPNILFVGLSDREIRRGEPLTVCYGVEHADTVRLLPIGLPLRPLKKDCTKFYPGTTLKYTLIASGPNGPPDKESFTVKVK
jgi:hypothetical protein